EYKKISTEQVMYVETIIKIIQDHLELNKLSPFDLEELESLFQRELSNEVNADPFTLNLKSAFSSLNEFLKLCIALGNDYRQKKIKFDILDDTDTFRLKSILAEYKSKSKDDCPNYVSIRNFQALRTYIDQDDLLKVVNNYLNEEV